MNYSKIKKEDRKTFFTQFNSAYQHVLIYNVNMFAVKSFLLYKYLKEKL